MSKKYRNPGTSSPEPVRKNSDAATPQTSGDEQIVDMREIGASGLRRFSGFIYEDILQELTGWKGIAIYKEMQQNDATVGAVLFAIRMLCRRVKWFTEAGGQTPGDKVATEFLESCMNDMSQTWIDTIDEILSFLGYGFSAHEIVYKRRCGDVFDPTMRSKYSDGRIGWRKLPMRSQDSIYRWQFDDHGGIQGVEQLAPPHYYHVTIPVEKMLLFRPTVERNNPEGRSILRTAYRSWYMKKNIENIEAIGVERDLAGLPMAFVPPEILSSGANAKQKQIASAIQEIVVNVRRNAQEGLLFPLDYNAEGKPRYDFKLLTTGGNRQFDTSAIITRYDTRIAMTVLADFILLGQDKVGSFALASSKTNLFSTAIGAFLDIVADVFNRYAIPRLFALNDFKVSDYPKIKHGDLGSVDLNELGQYIQRLSQSGMPLFPNQELEKHLLEVAGIPTGEAAPEPSPEIPIQEQNSLGKDQVQIPGLPVQTPSSDGYPTDTTPVNQKPPITSPVTNADGDTERTGIIGNRQDEEQFYPPKFGPQS
jgi:hypothetical protein